MSEEVMIAAIQVTLKVNARLGDAYAPTMIALENKPADTGW